MLAFVGTIIGYVVIGALTAYLNISGAWDRARAREEIRTGHRELVIEETFVMFLMWPVILPIRVIREAVIDIIDKEDPHELVRRMEEEILKAEKDREEQQEYIKQLEKSLGLID